MGADKRGVRRLGIREAQGEKVPGTPRGGGGVRSSDPEPRPRGRV